MASRTDHRRRSVGTTLAWVGTLVLWALPLEAASATFCGVGATPAPSEATDQVRLVSEQVRFVKTRGGGETSADKEADAGGSEQSGQNQPTYWRVETTYELENVSGATFEQTVEFRDEYVETETPDDTCSTEPYTVEVDGESRQLTDEGPYQLELTVPAGESRTVARTYIHGEPEGDSPIGSEAISYNATPGEAWKGTLGETRLVYELPRRPWDIRYPATRGGGESEEGPAGSVEYIRQREKLVDGEQTSTVVFGAEDWEPARDVEVYFVPPDPHALTDLDRKWVGVIHKCPNYASASIYTEARRNGEDARADEGLREFARAFTDEMLRKCRHAVYAHHGRDFDSDELDEFFYGSGEPTTSVLGIAEVGFQKNPDYREELLADWERDYAAFIADIEELDIDPDDGDGRSDDSSESPSAAAGSGAQDGGSPSRSSSEGGPGSWEVDTTYLKNLFMSSTPLLVPLGILAIPFLWFAFKNWQGRREMERATEAACLLCESRNLAPLGGDDFECLDCGYDSSWQQKPQVRELFQQLRELRQAERSFQRAVDEMQSAERWSWFDILWGSGQGKHGAMNNAQKAQTQGLSRLRDLADEYPELLEMSTAGGNVDQSCLMDQVVDFVGTDIEVHGQIRESTEEVRKYLQIVESVRERVVDEIREKADGTDAMDLHW